MRQPLTWQNFSDHTFSAISCKLSLNTPEQIEYHCPFPVTLLSDF